MTDPYRISETPEIADSAHHAGAGSGPLRPVLWLVLIVSAATNAAASSTGISVYVGVGAGLVTLACAAGLAVHHYRHRRG